MKPHERDDSEVVTRRHYRLIEIWADLFRSLRLYRQAHYSKAEFTLLRALKSLHQLETDSDLDEPLARCRALLAAVCLAQRRSHDAGHHLEAGLRLCDDSGEPGIRHAHYCLLQLAGLPGPAEWANGESISWTHLDSVSRASWLSNTSAPSRQDWPGTEG